MFTLYMILYFLTNSALEIGSAVIVWTVRTSYRSLSYGINYFTGNSNQEQDNQEQESNTIATQTD